ncbi:hypothetical protein PENSUB_2140 [Penicillium subrubescens]|uniref:Transcription factor domain-containing protein n=1 Tax=Penicillium subrubescens TaxID=1316194 RepID=A0A1Q5UIV3_9EURO|nr:hypothetical protein PENSUB_2140 [Penicillium subrubescens]
MAQEIIRMTGAAEAPPRILFNASADLYFDHVFYRIPVFDRADVDVETPHIAIQQAICMIGAMMRYPKGPNILEDNDMYYFKTKTLMHNSFAQDPITNLKVLALLSTRNVVGPTLDKLASASLGRPTALKENEFDVQPVTLEDFEIANIQALLFIERTKLALILGRILDLRSRPSDLADNQVRILAQKPRLESFLTFWPQQKDIYYSLRNWVDTLPLEARLFDGDKQRPYHHGIHELYILYFATIITFLYSFNDSDINSVPNIISLVASSCMVRLYHELDIRDDVNYLLTVHMWLFMLAAMPQLLYNAAEGLSEADRRACSDALDKLVSALGQFMIKIPGAETMLNTINRLRAQDHPVHPASTSREWRKHNLNGELHSVLAFRDLFPFPLSLSPRLELLDQLGDMRSVASPPPDINEDLGWILEEFADISTFTGWPSMLS